ncbi:hypothetical protein MAR_034263, partial [Mya arenaria]
MVNLVMRKNCCYPGKVLLTPYESADFRLSGYVIGVKEPKGIPLPPLPPLNPLPIACVRPQKVQKGIRIFWFVFVFSHVGNRGFLSEHSLLQKLLVCYMMRFSV